MQEQRYRLGREGAELRPFAVAVGVEGQAALKTNDLGVDPALLLPAAIWLQAIWIE